MAYLAAPHHVAALNAPKVRLAYVDEAVVDCRVRGMYKQVMRGQYDKVVANAKDTLLVLRTAKELDMDVKLYGKLVDNLYKVRLDFVAGDYQKMHNRIRDMHYAILANYLE